MITREELQQCKESVLRCGQNVSLNGLLCGDCWTPVPRLAIARKNGMELRRRLIEATEPQVFIAPSLREVESLLTREQQQSLAVAMFDWTAWTMRHGLGPGIMTALKNGQEEQILEAIEKDLAGGE